MRHERHKCNTGATQVGHECWTNNTSATPVLHERDECDTTEKFWFWKRHELKYIFTPLYWLYGKWKTIRRRNNLIQELPFGNVSFPCQNAFKKCTTKTKIFNGKSYIKKLYTRLIVATNALARFCIVRHSNAVSFLIKTILCENTNIVFSKNYWKLGKMNARFWKNI